MANAWPQRALGPWARAKKKKGGLSSPARYYCWVGIGPPFFFGPGPWAQGPLWPCIGHVWAYLIYFVIK